MPHHAPAPPARPFSPSPPRENRHSSSRPPSLLFGAPPTATSSVGLVLGLPPSPSPRLSAFPGAGAAPNGPSPSYFDHQPRRRRSSSSSVSTTSSASPPLGATPILAALEPTPISMPRSQRDGSVDDFSPSSTFPGEDRAPAPTTAPHAARAVLRSMPRIHQPTVLRTPSGRGLSFIPHGEGTRSRHASMLSNAVASGTNHTTISSSASSLAGVLARSVAVAATASSIGIPDRLEAAERVPRERVSAASLTSVDSAGSEFEDTFGRQKAARAAAKLGGVSGSRARARPALDIPPVPPLPPQFAAAQQQRPVRTDDGASRSAWEPSPAVAAPPTASTTTLDSYDISIDYDQRFGDDDQNDDDDDMDTTIDDTPELHEVGENNSTPATTPLPVYRSPPPSARSAASSKFHTPESRSSARFYTPEVKDTDKWRVEEETEHSLNEVKDPNAVASASSSSCAAKTPTPTADKTAYVPPYEPRRKHGKQEANGLGPAVALSPSKRRASPAPAFPPTPAPLGDDSAALSLTLIASLGSASGDPLALSRRRVELSLAWLASPPPSWWDYVPFARYAPRWTIRLASGASGRERAAGKRRAVATSSPTTPNTPPRRRDREADGIVQAVVGNLPIVGRFATWL
ncbi:uncharacterized protein LOC62_02G002387 [Vanrija pseudolonga]|uniref:Uncharacterized protein n=1 Tax=Vanrija pseudolonga TaxID=143232 RepID=A0AAF0Y8H1_9TREE|nr:hypothetical protein LOC62_02G002387 [Vanrija pseudolonga]